MKHFITCMAMLLIAANISMAQVAINTDGTAANASAMLDVKSSTQGVLFPRLSSSQRTGIVNPANGLVVYDTTVQQVYYYQGGVGWQSLLNGSNAFTLPYNATINSPLTLFSLSNPGTGQGISSASTGGTGIYGYTDALSGAGVLADNVDGGEAVTGRTLTVSGTPTGAVVGRNDGPGYGTYGFIATDNSGTGIGVLGQVGISGSTGIAGHFENLNSSNTSTALEAVTNGTGNVATLTNTNSGSQANALYVISNGQGDIDDLTQGNGGNFFKNNTNGVGAGVRGETNSIFGNNGTAGVYGSASGTGGYGGFFDHTETTGFGITLFATTKDLGVCTHLENTNASNTQNVLEVTTNGTGSTANFTNTNSGSTANTLYVTSNGTGDVNDNTQGNAASFFINNTNGVGAAVRGETNSIFSNAGTAGVYGVASGTGGYAGYFQQSNTNGFGTTIYAENDAKGDVLVCTQNGTSGDLAVFQTGTVNKARISRTGEGYFDGGTTNSGADLAEAFDVEGNFKDYEPGDVLEISADADRTVLKSSTPYSTLVAGVYATKPGVLLTEDSISNLNGNKVPMGVVGVIPTKVCNENGPIARGDLLVTSSKPGYAMKADINKVKPGQVLGKALQAFDGGEGKIKVLVNVR